MRGDVGIAPYDLFPCGAMWASPPTASVVIGVPALLMYPVGYN